jgi:hypothetical protein
MTLKFFPPANIANEQIKDVAKGMHDLCSAAVSRLIDKRDRCTSEVKWYNAKHV